MTGTGRIFAVFAFCVFFVFAGAGYAAADLYYWTDKDGKLHVTTNKDEVPEAFKEKATHVESKPSAPPPPAFKPSYTPPATASSQPGVETYGDKTAYEWKTLFDGKNERLRNSKDELSGKKQYIEVFERGRRFGQTYEDNEIKAYEAFKKDIPDIEKRIRDVEEELKDLKRDARYYGVPKEIVGD
ncbi:MAG: DUF4124 domain-containing protein [Deltaproteobacteria bacterium]|nr:DUF4124 domain-containing protein [Deltaproteobacteria bacterium]